MLLYQILTSTIYGKTHTKMIYLKYLCQRGMVNLSYLMDYILYQIFTRFENIIKRHETVTGNWKNEKKTKKTGYDLAFLIPETMKLLGRTKSKRTWRKCTPFKNYCSCISPVQYCR